MYCRSRPSQATPGRQPVDLQSNLGLGEELELLGLAPSCSLCQGSTNLEEHKELQVLLRSCIDSRTMLTLIVRRWILVTEICSMGKSLWSFKPIVILFFEAYGALLLEAN